MRILTILTSGGFSLFQSKRSEIYFPYENFDKVGTAPLFLPNTMKIKLLIIKLSLKARVLKLGLKAISSTQRVSVSDKRFGGELKVLKKYFQYRNLVKVVTDPLFLPNTLKIKLLIIKLSLKAWVLKLGRKAISSKIECV